MKIAAILGSFLLTTLFAVAPLVAVAAETSNPAKTAYLRYCSACHGESGKGDGVVAQLMRPRPTDLTKLSRENKGEFPFLRTMHIIDGRTTMRAHGDPDMPVWGEIFVAEEGMTSVQQLQVRGKVLLITEYLVTIQAE